jgi:cytochrome b subunit of formate dehydrogenase
MTGNQGAVLEPAHRLSTSEHGEGPYVWRFSRLDRALHLMVIISFYALLVTGIPLLFAHSRWAQSLIRLLGGVEVAGLIHRLGAILTFTYLFLHLGAIFVGALRSPDRKSYFFGPNSMVPNAKDWRDLKQMFRYFRDQDHPPKFDRFSYMEKFEYWGVFWGVAIMGLSGLLMWFPEFFAQILPGWAFNVATILHGREALLALGVIFTIHFYNVNLRPEKFPIDVVIFTGRATVDYMREEHPLEYERLVREGRLEERIVPPTSDSSYRGWAIFGFAALAAGILLVLFVVIAALA